MKILGIETSCDETASAIVEDGYEIYSNVIASQVELHSPYGGVVPELASRAHIQRIIIVVDEALKSANIDQNEIDAIAVTLGPGLIGSLLVGVEFGKTISYTWKKPLYPIHHIAGHLYTPFLKTGKAVSKTEKVKSDSDSANIGLTQAVFESHIHAEKQKSSSDKNLHYPYIGLVVSGGHSSLILVHEPNKYETIGETYDDAAGEAYDKVAKLLGLGYPGGPILDKLASEGNPNAIKFPRPLSKSNDFNFSFSGLKTSVMQYVKEHGLSKICESKNWLTDISASFQAAVIDSLLLKSLNAIKVYKISHFAIVGGVACNKGLRKEALRIFGEDKTFIPSPILCTDNAAMIAGLAFHHIGEVPPADMKLNSQADLSLN